MGNLIGTEISLFQCPSVFIFKCNSYFVLDEYIYEQLAFLGPQEVVTLHVSQ